MKKIIAVLLMMLFVTCNAQKVYTGKATKTSLRANGKTTSMGERKENFLIKLDATNKKINIQAGLEKETWMTIKITGAHKDEEGNLVYEGCYNYDGSKTKLSGIECYSEMIIFGDEIILMTRGMLFEFYLN